MLSLNKREAIVSHYSFSFFEGGIILEDLLLAQEKSPVNNQLVQNAWDAMGGRALNTSES